jgi:putative membrane protein
MLLFIVILIILLVFLLIFTLQNPELITFRVLFWQLTDVPLVLIVLVCLLAGFLLAEITHRPKIWRLKRENKRLTKVKPESEKQKTSKDNPEGVELGNDDIYSIFDE